MKTSTHPAICGDYGINSNVCEIFSTDVINLAVLPNLPEVPKEDCYNWTSVYLMSFTILELGCYYRLNPDSGREELGSLGGYNPEGRDMIISYNTVFPVGQTAEHIAGLHRRV